MATRESIINPQIHVKHEHAEGATGAAAVVTIAADTDNFWAVGRVDWSWSTGNGGKITIAYGGSTFWEQVDHSHGHGYVKFTFPDFLHNEYTKNEELKVTLEGISGAVGRLDVRYC